MGLEVPRATNCATRAYEDLTYIIYMGLFLSNFKLYNLSIVIFNLFYIIHKYNPPTRIELVTFALQVQRSTTELRRIYEVCEKNTHSRIRTYDHSVKSRAL